MGIVKNPILRGFHPDPSIVRVKDTYYIANSTFEYFPGVKISSSKDLMNWETETFILNEDRLLNMINQDSSSGVWAPCLTYNNDQFYLIYSNIRTFKLEGKEGIPFHDDYNYLITAKDINGPWSDPVLINCGGFDASLFHDEDGRKWFMYAKWCWEKDNGNECDHSAGFYGIAIQEYDELNKRLIGEEKIVFKGTERGLVEGPHMYRKNGYYYLLTAEGGTGYEHASTIARAKNIFGPYEVRMQNPHLITSSYNSQLTIQKAGHGCLTESQNGEWFFVHLCGRPLIKDKTKPLDNENACCILGRETALEPIEWINDWPYIRGGGFEPLDEFEVYYEGENKNLVQNIAYEFNKEELSHDFNNLRIEMGEEFFDLNEREGYLRIKGWESICSRHKQATLVRRQESFSFYADTYMEFEPESFQQMAGLIYRYNESNQYYLYVGYNKDKEQKYVSLFYFDQGNFINPLKSKVYFNEKGIYLKIDVHYEKVKCLYSFDEENWIQLGCDFDATMLSDEYCSPGFTGAMVGMSCQDFSGKHRHADFKYFKYRQREY